MGLFTLNVNGREIEKFFYLFLHEISLIFYVNDVHF